MSFVASAVAVTSLAVGGYQAYTGYEASKVQAENVEAQAEQERLEAIDRMERESAAASREASEERRKARARRSVIEAQYAKAGVLMDGSAADVLTKQRETDEANVRNIDIAASNRARRQQWQAEENLKQSLYEADSIRQAGRTRLTGDILSSVTAGIGSYGQFAQPKAPVPSAAAATPITTPTGSAFPTPKPLGSLPSARS